MCTNGSGTSIDASHVQGAVRAGRVLLVGIESSRASPVIGGTILCIDRQMNGFPYAVWAIVRDNTRKNAAVGLSWTAVGYFLEGDVC